MGGNVGFGFIFVQEYIYIQFGYLVGYLLIVFKVFFCFGYGVGFGCVIFYYLIDVFIDGGNGSYGLYRWVLFQVVFYFSNFLYYCLVGSFVVFFGKYCEFYGMEIGQVFFKKFEIFSNFFVNWYIVDDVVVGCNVGDVLEGNVQGYNGSQCNLVGIVQGEVVSLVYGFFLKSLFFVQFDNLISVKLGKYCCGEENYGYVSYYYFNSSINVEFMNRFYFVGEQGGKFDCCGDGSQECGQFDFFDGGYDGFVLLFVFLQFIDVFGYDVDDI